MAAIFISYRRSDSGGHAGRLFDRLSHWFDADALFYDLDGIDAGDTFPASIASALGAAKVVLVLIGPDWLATLNERAGKPDVDYVRHEVEAALQRHAAGNGMRVVPVLFGGTAMPSAPQFAPALQASLSALCALDAHEFRGKQADWDQQFVRLREHVAKVIGVPARFRVPRGTEQVFRVIDQAISPHFQDPNDLLGRLRETLSASGSAAVGSSASRTGADTALQASPASTCKVVSVSARNHQTPA